MAFQCRFASNRISTAPFSPFLASSHSGYMREEKFGREGVREKQRCRSEDPFAAQALGFHSSFFFFFFILRSVFSAFNRGRSLQSRTSRSREISFKFPYPNEPVPKSMLALSSPSTRRFSFRNQILPFQFFRSSPFFSFYVLTSIPTFYSVYFIAAVIDFTAETC